MYRMQLFHPVSRLHIGQVTVLESQIIVAPFVLLLDATPVGIRVENQEPMEVPTPEGRDQDQSHTAQEPMPAQYFNPGHRGFCCRSCTDSPTTGEIEQPIEIRNQAPMEYPIDQSFQLQDQPNDLRPQVFNGNSFGLSQSTANQVARPLVRFAQGRIVRSREQRRRPNLVCYFCKSHHLHRSVYTSHTLKYSVGNVVCPILSTLACPICNATGTRSHTVRYCPHYNRGRNIRQQQTNSANYGIISGRPLISENGLLYIDGA